MRGNLPAWGAVGVTVLSLVGATPNLRQKQAAEAANRQVCFALDWEDIQTYDLALNTLRGRVIVVPSQFSTMDETALRTASARLLWRLDDDISPGNWLPRFRPGDGVMIVGRHVLEHPQLVRDLPVLAGSEGRYMALLELRPNTLLSLLRGSFVHSTVKMHVLSTREMLVPKPELWANRLARAVQERWVRLLIVRFCPTWDRDKNLGFQAELEESLRSGGFSAGEPALFPFWKVSAPPWFSRWGVKTLGLLFPVLLMAAVLRSRSHPLVVYGATGALTIAAGMALHGLTASPASILGFQRMGGVKLQLVVPLVLSLPLLFSRDQLREWLEAGIRFKHAIFIGGGLAVLAGLYLTRSGNNPLLPVTDAERHLRDGLERVFGARPRFKEAFFAQPLFLLGLYLRRSERGPAWAGPALLWAGLVAPISILNTFFHPAAPLEAGILRSFHGLWLGCCLAIPVWHLVNSRQ